MTTNEQLEKKFREDYLNHIAEKMNTTLDQAELMTKDVASIAYFGMPFYLEACRKRTEETRLKNEKALEALKCGRQDASSSLLVYTKEEIRIIQAALEAR